MRDNLVCPECGSESFTATLTTRTEYVYNVSEGCGMIEVEESCAEGGDLDEIDTVECQDCGEQLYPEEGNPDHGYLITRELFDERAGDECV